MKMGRKQVSLAILLMAGSSLLAQAQWMGPGAQGQNQNAPGQNRGFNQMNQPAQRGQMMTQNAERPQRIARGMSADMQRLMDGDTFDENLARKIIKDNQEDAMERMRQRYDDYKQGNRTPRYNNQNDRRQNQNLNQDNRGQRKNNSGQMNRQSERGQKANMMGNNRQQMKGHKNHQGRHYAKNMNRCERMNGQSMRGMNINQKNGSMQMRGQMQGDCPRMNDAPRRR